MENAARSGKQAPSYAATVITESAVHYARALQVEHKLCPSCTAPRCSCPAFRATTHLHEDEAQAAAHDGRHRQPKADPAASRAQGARRALQAMMEQGRVCWCALGNEAACWGRCGGGTL